MSRSPPDSDAPPSKGRLRLSIQFTLAVLYLLMVAGVYASLGRQAAWKAVATVALAALFLIVFCLYWAYDWAIKPNRHRQFGLRSLFFGTILFCAFWMLVRTFDQAMQAERVARVESLLGSLMVSFLLVIFSSPFLLLMAESLVWTANWIVRRPAMQDWLARQRRS